MQVLFHCLPLRKAVLDYKPVGGDPNKNSGGGGDNNAARDEGGGPNANAGEKDMLYELHKLFKTLSETKKARGPFNHKRFILAVKASNALFDNDEHHDSHEFVNWLLDKVHEDFLRSSAQRASGRGQ